MESYIRELIWKFWSERNNTSPSLFDYTPGFSSSVQVLNFSMI